MKRIIALVTALTVFLNSACAHLPTVETRLSSVWFPSEIMQNMFEIQTQYDIETVKCLTGYIKGPTVIVETMEPTWINTADSVSAFFRDCSQKNTIGYYHNHPGWTDEFGQRHAACGFSLTDIETFYNLTRMKLAVISCSSNALVWMFRGNFQPYLWSGTPTAPQ